MWSNVTLVFSKLSDSIFMHPVTWAGFIRSIILATTAFGFHLSADQIAALMLVVESGLSVFTHQQVTSNAKLNLKETESSASSVITN